MNRCACCPPRAPLLPAPVHNRPALSAIAYRVGVYGSFRKEMLERILRVPVELPASPTAGPDDPPGVVHPLARWTSRTNEDPGIALLDAWARVLDVVTFHQERIANESYLRTARHAESVHAHAALLDYRPSPGMAAEAYLSFALEKGEQSHVPAGTKVQSVPGQDEKPQVFEVLEPLRAEARLNEVRILPQPQAPDWLKGGSPGGKLAPAGAAAIAASLGVGDALVVHWAAGSEDKTLAAIEKVEDEVRLAWSPPILAPGAGTARRLHKWKRKLRLFGYNAPRSVMVYTAPEPEKDGNDNYRMGLWERVEDDDPRYPRTLPSDPRIPDLDSLVPILVPFALELGYKGRRMPLETKLRMGLAKVHASKDADETARRILILFEKLLRKLLLAQKAVNMPLEIPEDDEDEEDRKDEEARGTILEALGLGEGKGSGGKGSDGGDFLLLQADASGKGSSQEGASAKLKGILTRLRKAVLAWAFANPPVQTVHLDGTYEDVKVGTRLLFRVPPTASGAPSVQEAEVLAVGTQAVRFGPLEATVTVLTLDAWLPAITVTNVRQVVAYELAQPEIALGGFSYAPTITGNAVYARAADLSALPPDRRVILDDAKRQPFVATVAEAILHGAHLAITLREPLARPLDAGSAVLLGNVALAGHGQTVREEVLGSGDASASFQSFRLRKAPVTHVPNPQAPHGAASTLEVRVDGIRWRPVRTLRGQPSDARVYVARRDPEEAMTVRFGDGGRMGAHLPSGVNNVTATYRQGIGRAGMVRADALTTLLDRVHGVKRVRNPLPAQKGEDPEPLELLRRNAPNGVRTFERIVSLRDFEDAAREHPSVARARATWAWSGLQRGVLLVVGGPEGREIPKETLGDVRAFLDGRRDVNRPLDVRSHLPVPFEVEATLHVLADHPPKTVRSAAKAALLRYAAGLGFGDPVNLSDVERVLQTVEGVDWVDVDVLRVRGAADPFAPSPQPRLVLHPDQVAVLAADDARVKLPEEVSP